MARSRIPPGRKLNPYFRVFKALLTLPGVLVTTQDPQVTYRQMMGVMRDHGMTLPEQIMLKMFEVLVESFKPFTIPFTAADHDRQHTQSASRRLRRARVNSRRDSGTSLKSTQSAPATPASAEGDSFYNRTPKNVNQSFCVSTEDADHPSNSVVSGTIPATTKTTYEYPGFPKNGPPLDINTSFSWPHDEPSFKELIPAVDLDAYDKPQYMKNAENKAAKVGAVRMHPSEQTEADKFKETADRVAGASKAKTSAVSQKHNSAVESQVSGDTQIPSGSIPNTKITDLTPGSTQETSTFSQPQVSQLLTQDTVYTVNSTQSMDGLQPSDSTTRVKKAPVSAAHPRRSPRASQSEPLTPEDITLGKRSRDSEASEYKAGNKKAKSSIPRA